MLHTFAVYVDNKPGVLNRVASLFRRRAFNIESLTVGHTETSGVSRMTVVVDTDMRAIHKAQRRNFSFFKGLERATQHRYAVVATKAK